MPVSYAPHLWIINHPHISWYTEGCVGVVNGFWCSIMVYGLCAPQRLSELEDYHKQMENVYLHSSLVLCVTFSNQLWQPLFAVSEPMYEGHLPLLAAWWWKLVTVIQSNTQMYNGSCHFHYLLIILSIQQILTPVQFTVIRGPKIPAKINV